MIQDAKYRYTRTFSEQFPLKVWNSMTLEKYTNLNRDDSFCYWLEFKTLPLVLSVAEPPIKFPIFSNTQNPPDTTTANIVTMTNIHGMRGWAKVRMKHLPEQKNWIVRIAYLASEGNLKLIDRIRGIGHAFKWKIAFVYSGSADCPHL